MIYTQKNKKNLVKRWLILIGVVLIGFFMVKAYWNYMLSPLDSKDITKRVFVIAKGESSSQIAERLQKEGLIRSSSAFELYLKRTNQVGILQAGDFKLSPAMSAEEVTKVLSSGSIDKWVTLLEGWRVEEMAEKLNAELGLDKNEFIKAAKEGYMFPDTYLFNPEVTPSDAVSVLKNTFQQRYDSDLQQKISKLGLTADQGVILASIVEREARSDEIRTQVASILLRRFKIDMGLNADATIQYILGYQQDEKSWWKRNLTYDDLKVESPYNTYLYRGLPPKPICNPSLSSLRAVANANPSTPYLYYFHDSKGNTYYGKTLEEHNENVSKYR